MSSLQFLFYGGVELVQTQQGWFTAGEVLLQYRKLPPGETG